ncbi:DUF3592 domain-containing protein [bacterium]|nr:DUF3592 domain-containing protein [bacterium]
MQKVFRIIGTVFFSIGLILLAVAFFIYNGTASFRRDALSAPGTVIDLTLERSSSSSGGSSSMYYPVVEYRTNDGETIRFRGGTGSNPPSFKRGQQVTVRYRPGEPYRAKIDSFGQMWLGVIITGSIGVPFFILGFVFLLIPARRKKLDAWLRDNGRIISADIDRVDLNPGVRVNGRNPYVIYAQWHDSRSGRIWVFKSKDIWYNPEKYIQTKTVHVRIHPDNPGKYVMDTSFLPESGEMHM